MNTKSQILKMRITEQEKEYLISLAALSDMSLSGFVRSKLMCENSVPIKGIPGLIETWNILNLLTREIEKSNNEPLITFAHNLVNNGRCRENEK